MGKLYMTSNNWVQTNGNEYRTSVSPFKFDKDTNNTVLTPNTNIIDNSFGDGRMYSRLKKRYKPLVFSWKDALGKQLYETYTPIMTIMKGKIANLVLHLDIKEEPQKIVFEFNNSKAPNFLQLSVSELNSNLSVTTTTRKTHLLNITCNGEFNDEYTLNARAFGKNDPKGEICGLLRILPNGQMYQHRIKVAFIKVKTDINPTSVGNGNINTSSTDRLNYVLNQALILPEIDDKIEIDARGNTFNSQCCKYNSVSGKNEIAYEKYNELYSFLSSKLDKKYENYYKIYYIEERCSESNNINYKGGYSFPATKEKSFKYTVCFKGYGDEVPIHELLHALELAHTFDGYSRNTKFTYHPQTTDNIMDYSHLRPHSVDPVFIYHWQWQIINLKIK